MNKFFSKITFVILMICFGNAFAQQVAYSLKDGDGRNLGQMVFAYNQYGYDAEMNG